MISQPEQVLSLFNVLLYIKRVPHHEDVLAPVATELAFEAFYTFCEK